MNIGTDVFIKINEEKRVAAIEAIADTMQQTARFGTFDRDYVIVCATAFFDETLDKVRRRAKRRTAQIKRKTTANVKKKD